MLPPSLVRKFPKLKADGSRKTSDASRQYNCIAWSAERDQNRWWQPDRIEAWDHWPPGVPDDGSFGCFIALFESLRYRSCQSSNLEIAYEKVALYADSQSFTHVASQLPSGAWSSKLGPDEDISHNSLEALEGHEYGEVKQILKRGCGLTGILARCFFKIARLF